MHALGIIILTPLAIMLGLILLGLVFTPWFWKALGCLVLSIVALIIVASLIPKASPQPPIARPMQGETMLQSTIDAGNAKRAERWQWIKTAGVDYPYLRAWAGVQSWSKIQFNDQLEIARRTHAPANAIHTKAGDWLTTDDIENSPMLSLLDSVVRQR